MLPTDAGEEARTLSLNKLIRTSEGVIDTQHCWPSKRKDGGRGDSQDPQMINWISLKSEFFLFEIHSLENAEKSDKLEKIFPKYKSDEGRVADLYQQGETQQQASSLKDRTDPRMSFSFWLIQLCGGESPPPSNSKSTPPADTKMSFDSDIF